MISRILKFFVTIIILIFFALEIYTLYIFHKEGNVSISANIGNFPKVQELLKDDPISDEMTFAVIGDTRGYGFLGFGTFERLFKKLREEKPAFIVNLGDITRRGDANYHRYFRAEMADEFMADFPMFFVIGNHDVKKEKFSINDFESFYGPSIFSFDYQGHLFVFLRILPGGDYNKDSIAFLENLFSKDRSAYNKVFVFMHAPIVTTPQHELSPVVDAEKLQSLFKSYNVDYVFAGHHHGYYRVKLEETVHVVTGGGGAELETDKFGSFHHAMLLRIGPNSISEDILNISRSENVEDFLESLAFGEIHPWLAGNPLITFLVNLIFLSILFMLFRPQKA